MCDSWMAAWYTYTIHLLYYIKTSVINSSISSYNRIAALPTSSAMEGSYVDYKNCTKQFTDWITNAASTVNKASKKIPLTLSGLCKRVDIITSDVASIHLLCEEPFLPQLPFALFAGSRAIGLRVRVSSLYEQGLRGSSGVDDAAAREQNLSHQHCINVLKQCHFRLSRWHNVAVVAASGAPDAQAKPAGTASLTVDGSWTGNRFDLLSEDDLTLLEEMQGSPEGGSDSSMPAAGLCATAGSAVPPMDIEIADIDSALGELRVVAICFMLDLTEATKQIDVIWGRVRRDELPILTAVAMTTVVLHNMDAINAHMQLQFPSIRSASDLLLSDAGKFVSPMQLGRCEISSFYDKLMLHYRVLCHFRDHVLHPHDDRLMSDGVHKLMMYDRNRDKNIPVPIEFHQLLPNTEDAIRNFFCAELVNIYNKCRQHRGKYDDLFHSFPSMQNFLKDILHFLDTKEITIPALLRCVCWMNIVQILQSKEELTLGRTVYMARLDSRRYRAQITYDDPILADLKTRMNELGVDTNAPCSEDNFGLDEYELYNLNPLLAGAHALDLMCSASLTMTMFKISGQICLLYSALRQEGFLAESIPFLEEYSKKFHKYIYGSESAVPVRGKYFSTSGLKFNISADAIRSAKGLMPSRYGRFRVINTLNF